MMRKSIIILVGILILLASMGILSKLFGTQNVNPVVKEDWNSYFSNIDGKIGSIFVNLGLKEIAPDKTRPNEIWVSIKMNSPRKDGLSSSEEYDLLGNVGEDLSKAIETKHKAIHSGRLTSDGHRDLYFYVGDTTAYEKTISEVMVKYPNYRYTSGIKEDKNWDDYLNFLYPTPEQYQSIQNAMVVANLIKNGDVLDKERVVDHWVYFKTIEDRANFSIEVVKQGFIVVEEDKVETLKDFPYQLHISRSDKVNYADVDSYILPLWKLAKEYNGDYDGWETSIVRK